VRGFCDHTNFGVVGMALPPRINLFRAQASRAVGGNGRRTSHNPPDPTLLDIYDRVGVVVMDENRCVYLRAHAFYYNSAKPTYRDLPRASWTKTGCSRTRLSTCTTWVRW
jgi:beta-galactosidase/beta-glucuronidase